MFPFVSWLLGLGVGVPGEHVEFRHIGKEHFYISCSASHKLKA